MMPSLILAAVVTLTILVLPSCAPRIAAPAKRATGTYHIVQAGENLYRIGKAYDVSHEELARVNKLREPDQIRIGQKIFVPGAARQLPVEVMSPGSAATAIEA